MKKYKLYLSGKGGEEFLFPLTPEQKEKLSCLDLDSVDYETIISILDIGDILDGSEKTYMGAYYDSELYRILIFNEGDDENIVWESPEDHVFEDDDYTDFCETDYLIVEDYIKGSFFVLYFECEEFDPKKLTPIAIDFGFSQIIIGFKYDGKDITDTKEYYDYWSKGFTYHLI